MRNKRTIFLVVMWVLITIMLAMKYVTTFEYLILFWLFIYTTQSINITINNKTKKKDEK